MGYLTLGFLILFTVIGILKYRDIYNPMTLFFGYWSCLIFLSFLHLYNFYPLSTSTFTLFLIGFISIFLGFYLTGNKRIVFTTKQSSLSVLQKRTYNYRIFLIINILLFIFIIMRVLVLQKMITSGLSWWTIRLIASGNYEGEFFLRFWGTNLMYQIYTYVVAPIIYMEAPMLIIMLYNTKYRNNLLIILIIINFTLFSIMTVSRNLMSFLIVYLVWGFFFFGKNKDRRIQKTVKKLRWLIPVVIVILIASIWKISALRITQEDIFKTFYIYMNGGLPSFEYRIEHFSYPTYTFGLYTLRGFVRPLLFIAHMFGINDPIQYQTVVQIAMDCEIYIPIGSDIRMNAFATIFYSLFRDGGYIGIILGSLMFGYLMKVTYDSLLLKNDMRSYVIYFLIVQQIFFSMARFYFVFPSRAFSYIWALILLVHLEKENSEIQE